MIPTGILIDVGGDPVDAVEVESLSSLLICASALQSLTDWNRVDEQVLLSPILRGLR